MQGGSHNMPILLYFLTPLCFTGGGNAYILVNISAMLTSLMNS
jgi:hypothetical protein